MAQFPINLGGGGGADLDQVTAGAAQILSGYTGVDSDGDALAGTMTDYSGQNITVVPSFTSTPNGQFTMRPVGGGYYDSTGRLQVAGSELGSAQTTQVLDIATFTSRYGLKLTGGIASKTAATFYPSGSDQVINSGQYLSGNQTMKAVVTKNIIAANVKYNVNVQVGDADMNGRLVNVTGSFTGDCTAAAAQIRTGYKAASLGVVLDGTLSINSATSFSVAQTANNTVRVTCATPAAATGRPWGGIYIRGKVGSYPTGVTDGFEVGRIGTSPTYVDFTSAALMPSGSQVYFRGWDYAYYNTAGSTASYPNTWYGSQHNIGGVYITNTGYATITSSGAWTVPAGANRVEFFAVGAGGGSGYIQNNDPSSNYIAGGCGGGYTATSSTLSVSGGDSFDVTIGAGSVGADGGTTSVSQGGVTKVTAAGGKGNLTQLAATMNGQNGGSGGGASGSTVNGTAGGSDGNNGTNMSASVTGGTGQGTTTAFNGVTYAGGGGGCGKAGASGGSTGGGTGASLGTTPGATTADRPVTYASAGTAGSGGGAGATGILGAGTHPGRAGGSGVVIAHYWHT